MREVSFVRVFFGNYLHEAGQSCLHNVSYVIYKLKAYFHEVRGTGGIWGWGMAKRLP